MPDHENMVLAFGVLLVSSRQHDIRTCTFQSGFRKHTSDETASLRILSDLLSSVDEGHILLLALLDVRAAFDTVDHSILLDRLSISFGLRDQHSTGCGRTQTVHYCGSVSRCAQSSVLEWPRARCSALSSTSSRQPIFKNWLLSLGSAYICTLTIPSSMVPVSLRMLLIWLPEPWTSSCSALETWMSSNRLRLNADKTQFIWLGTSHFLGKRDMPTVKPTLQSTDVNNLGVHLGPRGSSWIVRWANYAKFLLPPASVANSVSIAHQGITTHVSPR